MVTILAVITPDYLLQARDGFKKEFGKSIADLISSALPASIFVSVKFITKNNS